MQQFTFTRLAPRFAVEETVGLILDAMAVEQMPEAYLEELRELARRPESQLSPLSRFVLVALGAGEPVRASAGTLFREETAQELAELEERRIAVAAAAEAAAARHAASAAAGSLRRPDRCPGRSRRRPPTPPRCKGRNFRRCSRRPERRSPRQPVTVRTPGRTRRLRHPQQRLQAPLPATAAVRRTGPACRTGNRPVRRARRAGACIRHARPGAVRRTAAGRTSIALRDAVRATRGPGSVRAFARSGRARGFRLELGTPGGASRRSARGRTLRKIAAQHRDGGARPLEQRRQRVESALDPFHIQSGGSEHRDDRQFTVAVLCRVTMRFASRYMRRNSTNRRSRKTRTTTIAPIHTIPDRST